MYASKSAWNILTPKTEKKSVKKVMFAFCILCSVSSCVLEGMIWFCIFFTLMNSAICTSPWERSYPLSVQLLQLLLCATDKSRNLGMFRQKQD